MTDLLAIIPPLESVGVTLTCLVIPEDITFEDWAELGKSLQMIQRSIHWWIGDWIRFGERKWGEKYAQALEETPFSYQTLANDVWVASAIEPSRRKEKLTFTHHAVVAALPPAEQDDWLDKAEAEGWSSRKLWEEARSDPPPKTLYDDGEATLHHFQELDRWMVRLPTGVRLAAKDGAKARVTIKEA